MSSKPEVAGGGGGGGGRKSELMLTCCDKNTGVGGEIRTYAYMLRQNFLNEMVSLLWYNSLNQRPSTCLRSAEAKSSRYRPFAAVQSDWGSGFRVSGFRATYSVKEP